MIGSNTTTARVRLALEGQGQVVRGLQEVQAGVGSLRSAFASIAGGLSLGAAVGQLVQVQREMDVLNASMVTVTGSSRAAGMEMEWIKRFAVQTPYQLNEVTGAFVKMKALGLDASERALRSYGNTASAMGKDLNQFIEAVADAATGEFERLKEFGIKAKKEGDSVAFTFQGVTTSVRNNAADITTYLQAIGNNQFAGAMERRVASLDGAISNLADSWDDLARTVNEAGVGNLIETSVRGATAAISGLAATIRENKTELAVLAGGLGGAALVATLPKVGAGLMIVAGGIQALGLALAANPLVLALLGIGAAVGAAAAYSKVQSGTFESMARTVKELEALNARAAAEPWDAVLNANVEKRNQQIADLKRRMTELGQTARDAFALTDPRRTGAVTADINNIPPAGADDAWAAVRLKYLDDAKTSTQKLQEELAKAREAFGGVIPADVERNIRARFIKPTKDALDRMAMYSAEVQGEFRQLVIDKEAKWADEALKRELQSNEVESFFRQVEIEAEARWKAQDDKARTAAEEAAERLRAKEVAEWERANEQIAQSLTDSLMQGGRSFRDYLRDLFRTLVLRPILAPIATGLTSLLMPGTASAGQAGNMFGGLEKLIGNLGSIGNFLNGSAISSQLSGGFIRSADWLSTSSNNTLAGMGEWMQNNQWLGNAMGMAGNAFAGYGISKALSGGYSTGLPVNQIAAIASAFVGPIAGVVGGLVNRAFGRKLKDTGLEGTFSGLDGLSANTYQFYKGGLFRSNKTTRSALDESVRGGLADQYAAMTAGNAALAQALGLDTGSLAGFSSSFSFSTKGMSEEQVTQRLTEEFAKMADAQAVLLMGTQEYVRKGEAAAAALARLGTSLTGVNQVFDTLGLKAYAVSLAGGDMASSLADLFGGLDALTQASNAYYQAFYSEAERTATTERQLTAALKALGLELPSTREGFRALVEAQDLTTESGRTTYAALVQLSPVFADLTSTLQQLGSTVADEVRRLRGLLTTDSSTSLAALQAQFVTGTAMARAGDADALARLPELSQAIEAAAALQAVTAADVAIMRGQLAASLSETLGALGVKVPAFEVGTNYVPRTMLAQVHEGEAIVPRAYNPAAGGGAPGGDALAQRVEAMVAELQGLRAEVRSTAQHTAKTARILDRVARDGNAFVTVAEA